MAAEVSSKQMKRPTRGKSSANAHNADAAEPSAKASKLELPSSTNRRHSAPAKQPTSSRSPRRLRSTDGSHAKGGSKRTLIIPPSTERPPDVEDEEDSKPRIRRARRFGHDLPLFTPSNREDWSQWLTEASADDDFVWVVFQHKTNKQSTLSSAEAVEEAIAWGWMTGRKQSLDAHRYRQLFARRKPTSGWSTSDKICAATLLEEGRMHPSGQTAVETAQANGAWEMFDDSENLVVHNDLEQALRDNPKAMTYFYDFPEGAVRNILRWVYQAKQPMRAIRIGEVVQQAELNLRAR
eukprot:m.124632 g.124632  ORF g.124632 m.124632 type:complete len:295 (+) comp15714_c0_seq1:37-921(+)